MIDVIIFKVFLGIFVIWSCLRIIFWKIVIECSFYFNFSEV